MKILIFTAPYDYLLHQFYLANEKLLSSFSYAQLRQAFYSQYFGNGDSYAYYLTKMGHKVEEFIENDSVSQSIWAREQGIKIPELRKWQKFLRLNKREWQKRKYDSDREMLFEIAKRQAKQLRPDVILDRNVNFFPPEYLRSIRNHTRLFVGHVAYKVMFPDALKFYDVILTASHPLKNQFEGMGIHCAYLPHAFDSRILKGMKRTKYKHRVIFIGGLTAEEHQPRLRFLSELKKRVPIKLWTREEALLKKSDLRKGYRGEVWGHAMYSVLYNSKIVLNMHSTVAGDHAGNMRMYEATGVGSLLLTDEKQNNAELFEVGKEIVTYKDWKDAVKTIRYYLKNEQKRKKIAKAGQKRTLHDHTYEKRCQEMISIFTRYLNT